MDKEKILKQFRDYGLDEDNYTEMHQTGHSDETIFQSFVDWKNANVIWEGYYGKHFIVHRENDLYVNGKPLLSIGPAKRSKKEYFDIFNKHLKSSAEISKYINSKLRKK